MKVKIFFGQIAKDLEDKINKFIKDKQVVCVTQSESDGNEGYCVTISVWYKEPIGMEIPK